MHTSMAELMASFGVSPQAFQGGALATVTPVDGAVLAQVHRTDLADVAPMAERAHAAFLRWRQLSAPQRGELVRLLGNALRVHKQALGELVTLEVGKVSSEGLGEVQEMIDICDFAVVWKPSDKAPLCALAVQALFERACAQFNQPELTQDLSQLLLGHADVGQALVDQAGAKPGGAPRNFCADFVCVDLLDPGRAICLNNDVPQGLSSAIFTTDLREAETFMSAAGSDCGIVNVNIGTSGAEIGGAFGGAKETGGGRESGSDAWRAYMRRATNTINYASALPLAQGVSFDF